MNGVKTVCCYYYHHRSSYAFIAKKKTINTRRRRRRVCPLDNKHRRSRRPRGVGISGTGSYLFISAPFAMCVYVCVCVTDISVLLTQWGGNGGNKNAKIRNKRSHGNRLFFL